MTRRNVVSGLSPNVRPASSSCGSKRIKRRPRCEQDVWIRAQRQTSAAPAKPYAEGRPGRPTVRRNPLIAPRGPKAAMNANAMTYDGMASGIGSQDGPRAATGQVRPRREPRQRHAERNRPGGHGQGKAKTGGEQLHGPRAERDVERLLIHLQRADHEVDHGQCRERGDNRDGQQQAERRELSAHDRSAGEAARQNLGGHRTHICIRAGRPSR